MGVGVLYPKLRNSGCRGVGNFAILPGMDTLGIENLTIEPAPHERQSGALALVFRDLPPEQRAEHVAGLLDQSRDGTLPLGGLLDACRNGRQVGALWAHLQPGNTAALWPVRLVEGEGEPIAQRLLNAAVEYFRRHKVCLAQSLLCTDTGSDADRLRSAGFIHLSDLLYMVCTGDSFPTSDPREISATPYEVEPYDETQHERLTGIVERTYEQTLDCPDLDGVRDIADVLAGYRATGQFNPARWLFVRCKGRDAGCLLLTDHPSAEQWELIYMGVVPEQRGRGLGVELARYAQWLAGKADTQRLVLAVDAANEPAIAAYIAAGFSAWDRRSVFLRRFE